MNPQYQKMLRQVQDMQKAMAKAQEELAKETVEASAGGGTVTVVVTGGLEVREIVLAADDEHVVGERGGEEPPAFQACCCDFLGGIGEVSAEALHDAADGVLVLAAYEGAHGD